MLRPSLALPHLYGQLLHGGVTATLVDEAFGWATYGLLGRIVPPYKRGPRRKGDADAMR